VLIRRLETDIYSKKWDWATHTPDELQTWFTREHANENPFRTRLRLGVVCLTALRTIVVGANSYVVGMPTKSAACIQHPVLKTWHIFKRLTRANRMP